MEDYRRGLEEPGKWDEYVKAVDEMILRTSTTYAPWIIVEGMISFMPGLKCFKRL